MQRYDRTRNQIAGLVRKQLLDSQRQSFDNVVNQTFCVETSIEQISTTRRKLKRATDHRLFGACHRLQQKLRYQLADLRYPLETACLAVISDPPQLPSHHDICKDLTQLQDEFEDWTFDKDGRILSAITESIRLDDVYLGPFEIQLFLDTLSNDSSQATYLVIAQDPHSAAGNSVVTHPHVSDDRLCSGEASGPIQSSLSEGRLCDFFLLVRSVLQNYNSDSPYVRLEDWHGRPCGDCAFSMHDDDSYYCESCDESFCDECISSCRACDTTSCRSCLDTCPVCEDATCKSCLKHCNQCEETCCVACLDDDLCPTCIEEKEDAHENENQEENTFEREEATVQPSQETVAESQTVATAIS